MFNSVACVVFNIQRLKEKKTAPGRRPATPLTGPRRVQVLFMRGGKPLQVGFILMLYYWRHFDFALNLNLLNAKLKEL